MRDRLAYFLKIARLNRDEPSRASLSDPDNIILLADCGDICNVTNRLSTCETEVHAYHLGRGAIGVRDDRRPKMRDPPRFLKVSRT